jgi:DNA-binding transcriptional LysR family regulator
MRDFQWSDLKFFLELVRTGSPTAASRRLKTDHTTVRRRVAALEEALKAKLFSSRAPAYHLTTDGDRMFKYAEAVEALTLRAQEEVANNDLAESGTVRLGTTDGFGAYYLAPRITGLTAANPDLRIQLVAVPRVINLSNREADLAVALSMPDQRRQIVRRLTDFTLRLYGSSTYLDNASPINTLADLTDHRFVGYVPDLLHAPELDLLPEIDSSLQSQFEATSISAQIAATASGAGLCILPDFIASADSTLKPVLANQFKVVRQFWLVIHPEMVNLARVRAVIDFIAENVRKDRCLFTQDETKDVAGYEQVAVPSHRVA